eukprot:scaffold117079_cov22-Tisochrysis_lutea.AAC.2
MLDIFYLEVQVTNCAGESSSSNVDLLTNYGFIQPGNPYDTVPLITSQMQVSLQEGMFTQKRSHAASDGRPACPALQCFDLYLKPYLSAAGL